MMVRGMDSNRQSERRQAPRNQLPGHLERRRNDFRVRKAPQKIYQRVRGYLSNHRDVALLSLTRLLGTPAASLMTWSVIAIALALPAGLYVFLQNAQQLSSDWDRTAQISVYTSLGLAPEKSLALSKSLKTRPDIKEVQYISPEQALSEFRSLSGFGEALEYLSENPLPAVIVVYPQTTQGSVAATEVLLEDLRAMPEVDQAELDIKWVKRLYGLMALGQRAVMILGVVLSLAVLLVIGNTVRLAIESRRAEIVVVKLVGGTDGFVRRPFLYTGIWYGIGGGVLAWVMINLVLFWLYRPVAELVSSYSSGFTLAGLDLSATLILLCLSAALGWMGAWIAVGRHLSDIEPG